MNRKTPLLLLVSLAAALVTRPAFADEHGPHAGDAAPIRVLMMTGQNNHNWKATTPALVKVIEGEGRFELTVDKAPWEFGPDAFAGYDVVMSNWSMWPNLDQDPWSDETKAAFLKFMSDGGGLVVMHAGSSIHYQWPEFQALVGATWRNGKTWHGPKHEFRVTASADHPITRGVEPFTIFDELWRDMDPTGDFKVVATADTSNDARKQGPDEPMVMTTELGDGRGVNLVLGHDTRSIENRGFQQLLLRCLEWAATGEVASSQPAAAAAE